MRENVLVTGGSGTIGSAIVTNLASSYEVFNLDLHGGLSGLSSEGVEHVHSFTCDVTDVAALERLRDEGAVPGVLNHIVTVAGGMLPDEWAAFPEVELSVLRRSVDVNLFGHINVLHVFYPALAAPRGNKSVTMIGSINGKAAFGGVGYSAAKSGLHGLMLSLAPQLREIGARINIVSPGTTVTSLTLSESDKDWSRLRRRLLTERFATPEDLASMVRCVMENRSVEAQDIVVDSGQLASAE